MNTTLAYPVKNPQITQPFWFDNTSHPERKEFYKIFNNHHPGVDFDCSTGTKVFSSYPGIVVRREIHKGMGKVITTRNGNIAVLYAHLSKFLVKKGQTLKKGELIGISGATGNACLTPHLHFELRDISKKDLKNMVFKPEFGKEIMDNKEAFSYTVNNKNTQKTINSISKLYFGSQKYSKKIISTNTFLKDTGPKDNLKQGLKLTIPNYSV